MSNDGYDGPKRIPPASLAEVLAKCGDLVQRYLRKCIRGIPRHHIEEISQETYARLLRLLPGEPIEDLECFILGVARNVARDFAMKESRDRQWLRFESDGLERYVENDRDIWCNEPQNEAEMDQELARIARRLPRHLLTVLILCERDGNTYEEAAAKLGTSIHTIKKWLADAKARCQVGAHRR